MTPQRRVMRFACRNSWMIGVLHLPEQPQPRGVLIVTGGPQYRVGSHRQFVLLAQHLAAAGVPVMRFDYRGMGDSEGEPRTFDQVEDDLSAAVSHFFTTLPALRELVLWGLCDGATAAAFYAVHDQRVTGLILLNPWVRTEQGLARATLRHYYVERLLEADFWRKLVSGAFGMGRSITSLMQLATAAREPDSEQMDDLRGTLPQRLYQALSRFEGKVLVILSGADLGAREFSALQEHQERWKTLMSAPRVQQLTIPQANHTFARSVWRDEVATVCAEWIAKW